MFIETRQEVQEEAFQHISTQLADYHVETKGVYIQDVVLPQELVVVLTQREIANQEIQTFQKQRAAQDQRVEMEQAKGTADMQTELAKSRVSIEIKTNNATARKAEGEGAAPSLGACANTYRCSGDRKVHDKVKRPREEVTRRIGIAQGIVRCVGVAVVALQVGHELHVRVGREESSKLRVVHTPIHIH